MNEETKRNLLIAAGVGVVGGGAFAIYKATSKKTAAVTTSPSQVSPTQDPKQLPKSDALPPSDTPPTVKPTPTTPVGPSTGGLTAGGYAVVTTKDEPTAGDLRILAAPNLSAQQLSSAEKNGLVLVINPDANPNERGVWTEVQWPGGTRKKAARGFVHQAYLRPAPVPNAPQGTLVQPSVVDDVLLNVVYNAATDLISGNGVMAQVTTNDPAPAGDLWIRSSPSMSGVIISSADKNSIVEVLEADSSRSEPGVWAKIKSPGGRAGAAVGYSKKAYLKLV